MNLKQCSKWSVDTSFPQKLPENWLFGEVSGVAVDKYDQIWIYQRPKTLTENEKLLGNPAPSVVCFDTNGSVVYAFQGKSSNVYSWFESEHSICVDNNDHIWLTGRGNTDGQVLKFDMKGNFLMQIGRSGDRTSNYDTSRLGSPAGIDVDTVNKEIYVADGYGNKRVIVFSSDTGQFKRLWGAYGNLPIDTPSTPAQPLPLVQPPVFGKIPQFVLPHSVRFCPADSTVYVSDRQNDRVQVFTREGKFLREFFIFPEVGGHGTISDLVFSKNEKERK